MTDTVQRSDELDKKIQQVPNLDRDLANLIKYGHQSRRLINWVIICMALEVITIVVLSFVFLRQQHNQDIILNNHEAIIANCNGGNELRATELSLWKYLLALTPETPRTPEQQKVTDDFSVFVTKTFAPRDCSKIR